MLMSFYKLLKILKIRGLLIKIMKLIPYRLLNKSHNEIFLPFYHTVKTNHVLTKHLFNNPTEKKFIFTTNPNHLKLEKQMNQSSLNHKFLFCNIIL